MNRTLVGLSVGSGLEGADVAVIRTTGIGLDLTAQVERTARVAFPPSARDVLRPAPTENRAATTPHELTRNIAETLVHAVRTLLNSLGISPRDVFAVGLLDPVRPSASLHLNWSEIADRVAEQTGLTVAHAFRGRDRAAGGVGHPIATAADYLLFRSEHEPRLLLHLGSAIGILFIPAGARVSDVLAFDAGPGNQFLDALAYHGSRGRETLDPGGKKAVQGCCLEPLLDRWLEHPFLTRKPPKALHAEAFGKAFLLAAFETVRQLGAGLPDLLCTASHLVARSVAAACRSWLPAGLGNMRAYLSGGGTRNGFLLHLLAQQLPVQGTARLEDLRVPALARNAAAAGVLTVLLCDGVAGNLPILTGAAGGRLIGQLSPGDGRNWARCVAWLADQTGDYPRISRAA